MITIDLRTADLDEAGIPNTARDGKPLRAVARIAHQRDGSPSIAFAAEEWRGGKWRSVVDNNESTTRKIAALVEMQDVGFAEWAQAHDPGVTPTEHEAFRDDDAMETLRFRLTNAAVRLIQSVAVSEHAPVPDVILRYQREAISKYLDRFIAARGKSE